MQLFREAAQSIFNADLFDPSLGDNCTDANIVPKHMC